MTVDRRGGHGTAGRAVADEDGDSAVGAPKSCHATRELGLLGLVGGVVGVARGLGERRVAEVVLDAHHVDAGPGPCDRGDVPQVFEGQRRPRDHRARDPVRAPERGFGHAREERLLAAGGHARDAAQGVQVRLQLRRGAGVDRHRARRRVRLRAPVGDPHRVALERDVVCLAREHLAHVRARDEQQCGGQRGRGGGVGRVLLGERAHGVEVAPRVGRRERRRHAARVLVVLGHAPAGDGVPRELVVANQPAAEALQRAPVPVLRPASPRHPHRPRGRSGSAPAGVPTRRP